MPILSYAPQGRETLEQLCFDFLKYKPSELLKNGGYGYNALMRIIAREMASDPEQAPLLLKFAEVTISNQCNLRCKDCASFIPYYKQPRPMNLEELISSTTAFLDAVDYIYLFNVLGGEVFLQPKLADYLEFLVKSDKIEHIHVLTNATLAIPDSCIPILQNKKNRLIISYYGNHSKAINKIVEQCLKYKICIEIDDLKDDVVIFNRKIWVDFGDTHKRTANTAILSHIFQSCRNNCHHLWNGEFHACPRSAHAKALGLFEVPKSDYVPLTAQATKEAILAEKLAEQLATKSPEKTSANLITYPKLELLESDKTLCKKDELNQVDSCLDASNPPPERAGGVDKEARFGANSASRLEILETEITEEEMRLYRRRRIREIYQLEYIEACAHCNARADRTNIESAIQLTK